MEDKEVLKVCKDTLLVLINKRKNETVYSAYTDALPKARYIADPTLKWLMEQYETLDKNTKDIK